MLNTIASEPHGSEAIVLLDKMWMFGGTILLVAYYLRDFSIREFALSTTEVSRLAR